MNILQEIEGSVLPPNPIRVETALSRYPVHRLAKKGDIAIDIRERNESGEITIKWEVTHSPGPLAYKLDTLIINRRIEEATRPIPRLIKLGSLRDLAEELGLKTHNDKIRRSLHQNASTYIKSRIKYKLASGAERKLEAGFTRYSVVLTGEELPDGRKADAVYIVLNDIYMQVINGAVTRPLDYDYLKILPPAAQRFYELLSYQMYAAIKNDRDRAKLTYSELCKYAPLTRQTNWNIVRPQLARIHAPHKKSGYVGKIDFQDTTDSDGKPDWIILYQPGTKAKAEYRAFAKRGGPVTLEVESLATNPLTLLPSPKPSPLEAALISHGITPAVAAELVQQHGEEMVALQIEHLEWLNEKQPGKVTEPAAWLRMAITKGITPSIRFVPRVERERQAEAKLTNKLTKEREATEIRRLEREKEAAEKIARAAIKAYREALTPEQLEQLEIEALAQASEETQRNYESTTQPAWRRMLLGSILDSHIRILLQEQGKLSPSPSGV
jgi:hypothetical protein